MLAPESGPLHLRPRLPVRLELPRTYALSFGGFGEEAFAILGRLRAHPHVEQYRKEKEGIERHIMAPFRQYRDDLAVNLVLPNLLPFETERNVFSRFLKNDFGQGGCHHHLWMSFYRFGGKRLADIQLPHSIDPDGFEVGLWIGQNAPQVLRRALSRIAYDAATFVEVAAGLIRNASWRFDYYIGSGSAESACSWEGDATPLIAAGKKVSGLWVRQKLPREDTLAAGPDLVRHSAEAMAQLWPLYLFFAEGEHDE